MLYVSQEGNWQENSWTPSNHPSITNHQQIDRYFKQYKGLTPSEFLKQALKELTRQLRQTIIYVTHDQTEAMTLADQIALMKDGEIVIPKGHGRFIES